MQLKSSIIFNKSHIFSLDLLSCFIIEIFIKSKNYKILVLLDSRAQTYFINEDFVKNQEISLIKKIKLVHVEIIDGCLLSSKMLNINFFFKCSN